MGCIIEGHCRLPHLPPQINGLALGIGGLGGMWRGVVILYGIDTKWRDVDTVPGYIAHGFAYLCHLTTFAILTLFVLHLVRNRKYFLKKDIRCPSTLAAISTGPMAIATVCTSLLRLNQTATQVLWMGGIVLHVIVTFLYFWSIYITSNAEMQEKETEIKQIQTFCGEMEERETDLEKIEKEPKTSEKAFQKSKFVWNPSVLPPTVGIAVFASCSPGIGLRYVALFTLVVGIIWCVIAVALILKEAIVSRGFQCEYSHTAILCAPYALCCAAYWAVRLQYQLKKGGIYDSISDIVFHVLYVITIILYVVVLAHIPALWSGGAMKGFGTSAFTFPFVIVATSLVRSNTFSPLLGHKATRVIALFASVLATIATILVLRIYLTSLKFIKGRRVMPIPSTTSIEKTPNTALVF